jgi:hypothetical protein
MANEIVRLTTEATQESKQHKDRESDAEHVANDCPDFCAGSVSLR